MAKVFGQYQYQIMIGGVAPSTDPVMAMLVDSDFAANFYQSGMTYYSDVSAWEVTGTGYTAGGQETTGQNVYNVFSLDTVLKVDEVYWPASSIVAAGAIWYHSISGVLISYQDFGGTQTSDNSVFRLTPHVSDGIAKFSVAS